MRTRLTVLALAVSIWAGPAMAPGDRRIPLRGAVRDRRRKPLRIAGARRRAM